MRRGDPGCGQVVAGADAGERVALLGAGHGEHDEAAAGQRREREREPGMRVEIVAVRDHEPVGDVERGGARNSDAV